MSDTLDKNLSDPVKLARTRLPNRIIRSATYEGMADALGMPQQTLSHLYGDLLDGGCGTLITGALYVQAEGRMPWPHQGAADNPEVLRHWEPMLDLLHRTTPESVLVAQLAHAGALSPPLQTHPIAPSACSTLCGRATEATPDQIEEIIQAFARAAARAFDVGFDAIQIHAADGYLIHQFLSPQTNQRKDGWGQPDALLMAIIERVRKTAGSDLPIWIKLPWMDDDPHGVRLEQTRGTMQKLDRADVELCELSYGSMRHPLSVVRGESSPRQWMERHPQLQAMPAAKRALWPLSPDSRHYRTRSFTPAYNARPASQLSAQSNQITIIPTGGIHTLEDATFCINELGLEAFGLSRPLIHNPRLPLAWMAGRETPEHCTHCNRCLLDSYSHNPIGCTGGA